MTAAWRGLVHLLDRDLTVVCGCAFGFISASVHLTTCLTCLAQVEAIGVRREREGEQRY